MIENDSPYFNDAALALNKALESEFARGYKAGRGATTEIEQSAIKAMDNLRRILRVPYAHSIFDHAEDVMRLLDKNGIKLDRAAAPNGTLGPDR